MSAIDPENPVVKLCAAGVQAEQEGAGERAADLYRQAWDARANDFEASVAAHYLARIQPDPAMRLHWNRLALEHAVAAGEAASSFLPSLYLNVGHAQEEAGDLADAASSYERAFISLDDLEPNLADSLRGPIERARRRVEIGPQQVGTSGVVRIP